MPDWLGQAKAACKWFVLPYFSHSRTLAVVWEVQQIGCSVGPTSVSGQIVIYKMGSRSAYLGVGATGKSIRGGNPLVKRQQGFLRLCQRIGHFANYRQFDNIY